MIDLHTHSLISDGVLLPTELARRAVVKGYSVLAITDHADESNVQSALRALVKVARELNKSLDMLVIPGVELTHIPPAQIPRLVKRARSLGARIVVGHGESPVEPVAPGTNLAFIKAGVDILAHPGLVAPDECALAAKNGVHFEITSRGGHSLTNGHVASMAKEFGVKMLLNSDSHAPGDLLTEEMSGKVLLGAGLDKIEIEKIRENAKKLIKKIRV